jgi:hypothetical protein
MYRLTDCSTERNSRHKLSNGDNDNVSSLKHVVEDGDEDSGDSGSGGSVGEDVTSSCRLRSCRSCRRWCASMYATYASETSSCRLLRGDSEAVEKKVRRRKMRVTEVNIVRMVEFMMVGPADGLTGCDKKLVGN